MIMPSGRRFAHAIHAALWFLGTCLVTSVSIGDTPIPVTGADAGPKSYVLPYLMVILVVALGLAVVVRPVGRTSDYRPPVEE